MFETIGIFKENQHTGESLVENECVEIDKKAFGEGELAHVQAFGYDNSGTVTRAPSGKFADGEEYYVALKTERERIEMWISQRHLRKQGIEFFCVELSSASNNRIVF